MSELPPFDLSALPQSMRFLALGCFALAVIHTFSVTWFHQLARRFPAGSIAVNVLHFLGEVEIVFGFWAAILMVLMAALLGSSPTIAYLESVDYTEAGFVFVIMSIAATRPVLVFARRAALAVARLIPLPRRIALYVAVLITGPLLGSLITEPAAMTVTAILIKDFFLDRPIRPVFAYATLGLLFVNVSIGGTLTHFAAPPVLMVASKWGWTSWTMLSRFGWRAVLALTMSTLLTAFFLRRDLVVEAQGGREHPPQESTFTAARRMPRWITAVHVMFLALVIVFGHYLRVMIPLFLFFVGFFSVTRAYQDELKIREALLVAFFLGGLVTLGNLQAWWLSPIVGGLSPGALFWGTTGLTAITDNAALTYLGTLVPQLSDAARYSLVAGAVTGGGLTVIANAPNPAGYGILSPCFGEGGIHPLLLFASAVPYTLIAAACFIM